MPDQRAESAPIACTLEAGDFKARLTSIAELNRIAFRGLRHDDLRLELAYAAEARERVLQLVRDERACCAFLSFEVKDEPGLVRVTIQAPEAARAAVEMVFEPFRPKRPTKAAVLALGVATATFTAALAWSYRRRRLSRPR